jgi:hypothetical protein
MSHGYGSATVTESCFVTGSCAVAYVSTGSTGKQTSRPPGQTVQSVWTNRQGSYARRVSLRQTCQSYLSCWRPTHWRVVTVSHTLQLSICVVRSAVAAHQRMAPRHHGPGALDHLLLYCLLTNRYPRIGSRSVCSPGKRGLTQGLVPVLAGLGKPRKERRGQPPPPAPGQSVPAPIQTQQAVVTAPRGKPVAAALQAPPPLDGTRWPLRGWSR